jgi:hypothetical protein
VLLVPTHRYFLPWVPAFYLGVAYCADTLFNTFRVVRREGLLVSASAICLCYPNFLTPRPNLQADALRQIAPLLPERPRIAASWADPAVTFGFYGNAEPVSAWDGIQRADIEAGRVDVLIVDANLRASHLWNVQREFFETFEISPERHGFKKWNGSSTIGFCIYYKEGRL